MIKFNYQPIEGFWMTSPFGPRNTGIAGASTNHQGIDGVGKRPDLILVHDGTLIRKWWNAYRGWACLFDVGQGHKVLYQHMKYSCSLEAGMKYPAGTVVGLMGNSRDKSKIPIMAAHLHFEVHRDDRPVDPASYIAESNLEEYEMVTETKIKVDGKIKTVQRILKDGENFVRLRDMEDVLGVVDVEYDAAAQMPIVTD